MRDCNGLQGGQEYGADTDGLGRFRQRKFIVHSSNGSVKGEKKNMGMGEHENLLIWKFLGKDLGWDKRCSIYEERQPNGSNSR